MNGNEKTLHRKRNGTVASRLATVETRVEALHTSVESLTTSVESLTRRIGNVGKMNWPLFVAGLGVLATWTGVVGFVGRMAIEPVKVEMRHLSDRVTQHQADGHPHTVIGQMNALNSRTNERFAEVETQIGAVRNIRDLNQKHVRELIDMKARLAIYNARFGPLEKDNGTQPD